VSLNFANVLDILCLRDAELSANEMNKIEMNKIEMNKIEMNKIEMNKIEMNKIEMNKIEIKCCSVKNGRRKGSRDVPPLQISARGFIFNSR
jgi:hypothetical protein